MGKATVVKKASTNVKHDKPTKTAIVVSGAAKKLLDITAVAAMTHGNDTVEKKDVIAMAGKIGKSTAANAWTLFKRLELCVVAPDTLTITSLGKQVADTEGVKVMKTNEEYWDSIKENYKFKPKEIELFDLLTDGKVHQKKDVAEELSMKMNSTFANLLTGLKKKKAIVYDSKTIQMADEMFRFGRPN